VINNKKVIGIIINKNTKKVDNTDNLSDAELLYAKNPFYKCPEIINRFIIKHGAFPLFMTYDADFTDYYLEMIDGLLMIGDKDISSQFYGNYDKNEDETEVMNRDKMIFQKKTLNKLLIEKVKDINILGICAGHQSLNVAMGGDLIKDIASETNSKVIHNPKFIDPKQKSHMVKINKDSLLYDILKVEELETTSNHHQAVKNLGNGLGICATCIDDGIIESIEYKNHKFCLGVQWHIEREADEYDCKIVDEFIGRI